MNQCRFTRSAEEDLRQIADFTLITWGERQADRYLSALESACQMLAKNPNLGRECFNIRPGLRRMEHAKHILFYRQSKDGIVISRILHQRTLPEQHEMDAE